MKKLFAALIGLGIMTVGSVALASPTCATYKYTFEGSPVLTKACFENSSFRITTTSDDMSLAFIINNITYKDYYLKIVEEDFGYTCNYMKDVIKNNLITVGLICK
jgi:hypothetical protein